MCIYKNKTQFESVSLINPYRSTTKTASENEAAVCDERKHVLLISITNNPIIDK